MQSDSNDGPSVLDVTAAGVTGVVVLMARVMQAASFLLMAGITWANAKAFRYGGDDLGYIGTMITEENYGLGLYVGIGVFLVLMGAIWCLWILSGKHAGGKVRLQKYDTGRGFIPFIIILVLVLVAGPAAYLMPKNAGSLQPIVDGGYAALEAINANHGFLLFCSIGGAILSFIRKCCWYKFIIHLIARTDTPFPPILPEVHRESERWSAKCCAEGRSRRGGCASEAWKMLLLWMAADPASSPHRRDSRKRSCSRAPLPSAGSIHCICPAADGNIFHCLPGDGLVECFQGSQLLFKCCFVGNAGHIGMVIRVVGDGVTLCDHLFYQFRTGFEIVADDEKGCRDMVFFSASRMAGVQPFSYPASKVR